MISYHLGKRIIYRVKVTESSVRFSTYKLTKTRREKLLRLYETWPITWKAGLVVTLFTPEIGG